MNTLEGRVVVCFNMYDSLFLFFKSLPILPPFWLTFSVSHVCNNIEHFCTCAHTLSHSTASMPLHSLSVTQNWFYFLLPLLLFHKYSLSLSPRYNVPPASLSLPVHTTLLPYCGWAAGKQWVGWLDLKRGSPAHSNNFVSFTFFSFLSFTSRSVEDRWWRKKRTTIEGGESPKHAFFKSLFSVWKWARNMRSRRVVSIFFLFSWFLPIFLQLEIKWFPSRVTGFSAVQSLSPLCFGRRVGGSAHPICQSAAWPGLVLTGLVWMGMFGLAWTKLVQVDVGHFFSSVQCKKSHQGILYAIMIHWMTWYMCNYWQWCSGRRHIISHLAATGN